MISAAHMLGAIKLIKKIHRPTQNNILPIICWNTVVNTLTSPLPKDVSLSMT